MKAANTGSYGPANVIEIVEVPAPVLGVHDVLVEVRASLVSAGDRRLRSADFPGISAVPGRLMMGVFQPRHPIQGTMFGGCVVEVGSAVTRFAVGDDVFGSTEHGAYAEVLAMPEDGAMAQIPAGITYEEAAAVPYGAGTALHFLRDLAAVQPGEKVLIVGASGGVGRFAVQVAKHLGAEVTGVCGADAFEMVKQLGADHLIDHRAEDFADNGQLYDVVFDIAGVSSFGGCQASLAPGGRYLTLLVSLGVLAQMAMTSVMGDKRALFSIALDDRDGTEQLRDLMQSGVLSPVIGHRFPLDRIAEAHAETGRHGAVVVTLGPSLRSAGAR